MINILLYLITRYLTLFPVALIPGLSWAVFGLLSTSLFIYYPPVGADYVFTPIALAYIYWTAYRRDSWGGLVSAVSGSLLGLVGAPVAGHTLAEILAGAIFVFWYTIVVFFDIAGNFLAAWAIYAFWAGYTSGLFFVLSILFGFVTGFLGGILLNGFSMYISFVTSTTRQLVHRMLHNLPPGVMALAALPVSTFFAAAEVFVAFSLVFLVANFALGFFTASFLIAVMLGSIPTFFFPGLGAIGAAKVAADVGSYIVGMLMARAWHRLEGTIVSPGVMFGAMVAYAAEFLSPASILTIAMALLLSRRRGHEAYTWIAVALMSYAFFFLIGLVPRAWTILIGAPMPWTRPV
jgi:hypothetical protein